MVFFMPYAGCYQIHGFHFLANADNQELDQCRKKVRKNMLNPMLTKLK
jgi:hypothetical protein